MCFEFYCNPFYNIVNFKNKKLQIITASRKVMPVHQVASYCIKEHVKMRNAFAFYLTSGDWLLRTKISIFNTLSFANEQFYDPIKGTLQFDVSDLVLIKPSGRNQVRLQRLKNKLDKQEIDGIKRSILAIGDAPVVLGDWQQSVYFL